MSIAVDVHVRKMHICLEFNVKESTEDQAFGTSCHVGCPSAISGVVKGVKTGIML